MTDALHSVHFDDVYFSVHDGLAESTHVFLNGNSLPDRWQGRNHFTICETGFGTGRNFLNTWTLFEETTNPQQTLHYYAFEKYPLAVSEIVQYLEHWASAFDGRLDKLVKDYPLRVGGWHTLRLNDRVTLTLIFDDMNRALPELDAPVDCWFLDGHSPAKNPDIWSEVLFTHMARLSAVGATVATYTAAVFVRKGLEAAGFKTAKIRGFKHKLEMLTGIFGGGGLQKKITAHPQKIAVIGGGIAGAACVLDFMQRGAEVHLFEKTSLASGGSGNLRGLFNPRFSAQRGFESDFYSPAFSKAHHLFQDLSASGSDIGYAACGSLHLVLDADKRKRFQGVMDSWGWHDDHLRFLNQDEASTQAGIPLHHPALFLPDAGTASPARVTALLAGLTPHHHPVEIPDIHPHPNGWQVGANIFDAVVIASGIDAARFSPTAHLPLQSVRGQISYIGAPEPLKNLQTNLCYGGYCARPFDGQMVVGSTFQHWLHDKVLRDEDHRDVLAKLATVTHIENANFAVWGGRASFRCAAKDRVPIIGQVTAATEGLYISAAHGSHGMLSAQMAAAMIAAEMFGEGQILPRSVTTRLSPQRFSHQ